VANLPLNPLLVPKPAGMLNKGVLALNSPLPGLRGHFMLTKTLEWNLRWCILDSMFDDRHFRVARGFINDPEALRQRFKCGSALHALHMLFSSAHGARRGHFLTWNHRNVCANLLHWETHVRNVAELPIDCCPNAVTP